MQIEEQTWDCVIIGGGIAGLTASIYLAQAGKSVLVLEKSKTLGGRGRTTNKMDSYLNLGPHALYTNGKSIEILNELGIEIDGGIVPTKGKILHNDKIYDLPATAISLLTSPLLSWKAKKELFSFFIKYKTIDTNRIKNIPLHQWLQHKMKNEVARQLILMLSRLATYSNEPERISAGAALKQLQLGNAIYLHYGWQSMINALEKRATEAGVHFQTSKQVKKVNGSFPQFTVHTNDEMITAHHVLSTSTPHEIAKMFSEHERAPEIKECHPVYVSCIDLVLSRLPNPNIDFALSLEDPFYFSNHSRIAKLSERDYHVVHVMKYTIATEDTERELEDFIEKVQPGWKEYVVYKRYLPRMIVSNGLVLAQSKRPSPKVDQIPGFYIAGDWVGDGMLVDASFQSARKAAQLILENTR
ncbi:FAD-dependent oxidoreductase [Bacillus timonensis]|uniref:FAD-dependent oxidoreductase n=1 Tax=Bacillus timonensis TaxID=1033734 RepID=A0A4S3PRN4_9BACI|nr:FAD-dependent oxidoreductase [Bacillus timonensis]THE12208.1 FAD-dependent oxidoreductase [Bacillus timonensis]